MNASKHTNKQTNNAINYELAKEKPCTWH